MLLKKSEVFRSGDSSDFEQQLIIAADFGVKNGKVKPKDADRLVKALQSPEKVERLRALFVGNTHGPMPMRAGKIDWAQLLQTLLPILLPLLLKFLGV